MNLGIGDFNVTHIINNTMASSKEGPCTTALLTATEMLPTQKNGRSEFAWVHRAVNQWKNKSRYQT